MRDATTLVLAGALALAGCATGARPDGVPRRNLARNVLLGVAVASAAVAVGAAVAGNQVEKDLRSDLEQGTGIAGRDFADRDADGRRWNRLARASAFVSGLSLLGVGIVWEMGIGDRLRFGPAERPADMDKPIMPAPPSGLPPQVAPTR